MPHARIATRQIARSAAPSPSPERSRPAAPALISPGIRPDAGHLLGDDAPNFAAHATFGAPWWQHALAAPATGANHPTADAPDRSPATVIQRNKKRWTPAQHEQSRKFWERKERRTQYSRRVAAAKAGFHEMIGSDAVDQHKYPLDSFRGDEPVDKALDRLPHALRKSPELRAIVTAPDAAHGQSGVQTHVSKNKLQEALAAHQFAREKGLHNVAPHSSEIDFHASDAQGGQVLFDPFMSPMAGEGSQPDTSSRNTWAQASSKGSYYKHTHAKGGDERTIGVWDKTYTPHALEADLNQRLTASTANVDANVHAVRVPIADEIAREHVAAEDQIAADRENSRQRKELEARYNRAQRRKPSDKRGTLATALLEEGPRGEHWRGELQKLGQSRRR